MPYDIIIQLIVLTYVNDYSSNIAAINNDNIPTNIPTKNILISIVE